MPTDKLSGEKKTFKRKPVNNDGKRNIHVQARFFDGKEGEPEVIDAYQWLKGSAFDFEENGGVVERHYKDDRELLRYAILTLKAYAEGNRRLPRAKRTSNDFIAAKLAEIQYEIEAIKERLEQGIYTVVEREAMLAEVNNIKIDAAALAGGGKDFDLDDTDW